MQQFTVKTMMNARPGFSGLVRRAGCRARGVIDGYWDCGSCTRAGLRKQLLRISVQVSPDNPERISEVRLQVAPETPAAGPSGTPKEATELIRQGVPFRQCSAWLDVFTQLPLTNLFRRHRLVKLGRPVPGNCK